MPKIKVELSKEVIDGQPITFVAPCDCSDATGLKVSYPGGAKEFVFKDSHGNALTGITELFLKDAYVRVIVDTVNGNAFIQNADTNAYLEAQLASKRPNTWMPTASDVGARPNTWTPTASDVGALPLSGGTLTGSLKINGSWKGISFDENASILNAGARLTFDQRPQNSTGSFERYILPTPTERTGDVWYSIFTAKNIGEISSTASASNNYHTAHFAKIGKTVICTLLPKALGSTVQYEETITIPTGYSPSAQTSFPFFSDTAKNAGDSTGKVAITANTNGSLYISASHGFTLAEVSKTICWVTA